MADLSAFTLDEIEESFMYLDGLRESGVTNMAGAGPFLEREFEITRSEARALLMAWVLTFDDELSVPVRAAQAMAKAA